MKPALVHEDEFLRIFWEEPTRIISIDWKETTSTMTDEDFKGELTLFAKRVEDKKAPRILIDVSKFRHRPSEEMGKWRRENITTRYNATGVRRFAFLLSRDSPAPATASQSSEGESFLTQSFNSHEQAIAWLTASE
jgi:hypothetical protein